MLVWLVSGTPGKVPPLQSKWEVEADMHHATDEGFPCILEVIKMSNMYLKEDPVVALPPSILTSVLYN